jgi:hypothetical protein
MVGAGFNHFNQAQPGAVSPENPAKSVRSIAWLNVKTGDDKRSRQPGRSNKCRRPTREACRLVLAQGRNRRHSGLRPVRCSHSSPDGPPSICSTASAPTTGLTSSGEYRPPADSSRCLLGASVASHARRSGHRPALRITVHALRPAPKSGYEPGLPPRFTASASAQSARANARTPD